MSAQKPSTEQINIGNLRQSDLDDADRIFRLAFGTFLNLPDPLSFAAGTDFIRTRWRMDPTAFFGARIDEHLVGSNFATNWGSVGFFGPLTIHPQYWDRGIGKRLMEPVMDTFARWGTKHAGLFTFAQSQKHVGLYQSFGFWPRFLIAIMALPVKPAATSKGKWQRFSALAEADRKEALDQCRKLTSDIYEGLDLEREICSVQDQSLGDTILLWDDSRLEGVAICHSGQGSEAGPERCHVKFGAVSPGSGAAERFDQLLSACEELTASEQCSTLSAGVNVGRIQAYQQMLAKGFRTEFQGVAMHRPNEEGYSRPGIYAIDDWR